MATARGQDLTLALQPRVAHGGVLVPLWVLEVCALCWAPTVPGVPRLRGI